MSPSQTNPTGRFTGLADLYARCRPGYPAAALDYLLTRSGLGPASLLVDVGAGTGISTRLLASRGLWVIGVEPNAEMRARAEAEPLPPGVEPGQLEYRAGTGEVTGLPAECADAVLAAQAFHWFEPDAALAEFRRILKPGGYVALMWNERDESDAFTAAYGEVLRSGPGAAELERQRAAAGKVLLTSEHFVTPEVVTFVSAQELDEEDVLGRAFSASYAPRPGDPAAVPFAESLRQAFARYQENDRVRLCYITTLYLAAAPLKGRTAT